MKPLLTPFAAIALAALVPLHTHAQGWETIVDLSDPSVSPFGSSIMLDPFSVDPALPDLFIGGRSADGSVLHVGQSTDPVTVTPRDTSGGSAQRLAQDPFGNLYSAGFGWQVRRSTDGGVTWAVVDDVSAGNSSVSSYVYGLATDGAGNVYASGHEYVKRGKQNDEYWVVRKGANTGQNWTTTYRSGPTTALAGGCGVVHVPPVPGHAGGIFAVGTGPFGSGRLKWDETRQWTVVRSRDAGASWQRVDAWGVVWDTQGHIGNAHPRAITADAAGNIYVAGYDGTAPSAWHVRRSSDGGESWKTILTEYMAGDYNRPDDIAADPWGNVYVVGLTLENGSVGGAKWTIRRWDATSKTWDNGPDAFRYPMLPFTSETSYARGVTTDALGRVYVTGRVDSSWIVQRLVP